MGVIQRCEIKKHEPFKGDACPECNKIQQTGRIAGWLVIAFIMSVGVFCWMMLAKKL